MKTQLAMALWLDFADSEVSAVAPSHDGVRIRMAAAHVLRSEAGAGKPVEGFARGVELLLPGAALDGAPGGFMGRISLGRVQIGGRWSSRLPLPFCAGGDVKLELAFANQSNLVLAASGIECRYEGEPNFSDSLFC